ncbi:hypothetical protein A2U01_0046841 [Trifolium medium]|uniref:Uncharacterized protein n=1 Tax=Trifolium medium TaxID=97028 RepID=A0A392QPS2_9FABA|nr:hypothetical protein [Trifolium medium]
MKVLRVSISFLESQGARLLPGDTSVQSRKRANIRRYPVKFLNLIIHEILLISLMIKVRKPPQPSTCKEFHLSFTKILYPGTSDQYFSILEGRGPQFSSLADKISGQ